MPVQLVARLMSEPTLGSSIPNIQMDGQQNERFYKRQDSQFLLFSSLESVNPQVIRSFNQLGPSYTSQSIPARLFLPQFQLLLVLFTHHFLLPLLFTDNLPLFTQLIYCPPACRAWTHCKCEICEEWAKENNTTSTGQQQWRM